MLLFISLPVIVNCIIVDFKTSHVIVYLEVLRRMQPVLKFQNISCYCLSFSNLKAVKDLIEFQNISCYCLSDTSQWSMARQHDFKTSHVIVYLVWPAWRTVYNNSISKHLMLLFIQIQSIFFRLVFCISKHLMLLFIVLQLCIQKSRQIYFKTSHVIVYHLSSCLIYLLCIISKHLMLLFI